MSWGFSWRGRWPALAVTLVATLVPIQASDAPSYDYSCYTFQSNSPGTIVPSGDIIQLVGSSYEAYCLFDPRRVNVDDVYFIKRSRDIGIEEIRHTVVNESAISIQVLEEEPIAYDLRCMMRNHTRDAFLCGRTVRIGYKPADVENFSCISENWQKLNCTWDIPPNPALVTYNLTYVVLGFLDTRACPNSIKTTTWCAWEGTDFNIRRNWVLTFTANNKLTQDSGGVSYSHEVDVFKSVIPKALDNLEVEVKSPYEVQLSWYLPHPIDVFTGNVVQEVQYKLVQAGNNTQPGSWTMVERWKVEPGRFERKLFTKAIADLRPYVMYEFQVRLHTGTGPIREHMWSEPATKRIRTPATIPQKAPVTDIGTFMVESSKSRRDIYINWQKVDPLYWNGPDFRYEISVFDGSTNSPIEITPDEMQAAYARFTNMEKEVPFRFEILPVNDIGRADDSVKSTVVVPAMSAMIDYPSFFKVIAFPDEDSITYSARWRLPHAHPDHNIESVTLYWCRQNQYEDRCMTKLEWINVDDPNSLMRNLTGFDKSHRYIFGVSANSHNSSSGISWISCIATYGTTPPPIESFNVTEISSKTIKVKWNLDCKAKAAIPTGFNISYCKKQQLGNECEPDTESYEEIYEETATEYVIKDLHPFTTYSITIASITPLGLSRWSNTIAKTTKPDKPSGPPQNLKTVSRGQNWIQIAMEPPEVDDRNGRIEKYIISTTQPLPAKHVAANTYSHVTYYNRTNLEPNEHYTFMVVACTSSISCGDEESAAVLNETTKIGVPGKIDYIMQDDDKLEWEIEDCNADDCFYELSYTFNGTSHFYRSKPNQVAVSFQELNITCGENSSDVAVVMRAGSLDEDNKTLYGPKMEKTVTCGFGGVGGWVIVVIAVVSILITLVVVVVMTYGKDQVKAFMNDLRRHPDIPTGLVGDEHGLAENKKAKIKQLDKMVVVNRGPDASEEQDLMCSSESLKQQTHKFGDSTPPVPEPCDSSGCSTGGDSESTSGSDRGPPSSDSGTVQEEPAAIPLTVTKPWPDSVRHRPPAPPYVCPDLANKTPNMRGYVSVGSVPNLTVGMNEGTSSPFQQSTPSLGLGNMPQVPFGARRTSTGYISMPTDGDGVLLPMEDLGTLPPQHRPEGFPMYSRHFNYKKLGATEVAPPYIKAQSLPWLNTGYVAVAQAEDGSRPRGGSSQGYVAVGEAMGGMKEPPSLPMLLHTSKSPSSPDEQLPPGAYCKVGARGSPAPQPDSSPGYVSLTDDFSPSISPPQTSPVNKSPYVTYGLGDSFASASQMKEFERPMNNYIAVGDVSSDRWAHTVLRPASAETREVVSAPTEGLRTRHQAPLRPNTSETNNNRGGGQYTPLPHSLSKQSSGYASGNVSQETLAFHEPLVMSPKKLLARSNKPHHVVYSPNHKPSMV